MRLQNERESENVEDRRGISPGRIAVGGGIGTIVIVLLLSLLTGADPRALLQQARGGAPAGGPAAGPAAGARLSEPRGGEAGVPGQEDARLDGRCLDRDFRQGRKEVREAKARPLS